MISMVRPGEGGIYDTAKVFMVGRYRNRVTGIIEEWKMGTRSVGGGKRRSSDLVTSGLIKVPSAHAMNNVVDTGLNFRVQGGVRCRGSMDSGIICKQRNIGNGIGEVINVCEEEQGPKMEPLGTPDVTDWGSDKVPFTVTH